MVKRLIGLMALAWLSACDEKKATLAPTSAPTIEQKAEAVKAEPVKAEPPPAASDELVLRCIDKDGAMCSEYRDVPLTEFADLKASCEADGEGAMDKGLCPKTPKLLGRCEHQDDNLTMFLYKSETIGGAKDAKELCDDGKWIAAAK